MPIDCFVFCTFIEWEAKTPTLTVAKMDESNFARSKKNSWFVDTIVFKGTTFGHNSSNADQKKKKKEKNRVILEQALKILKRHFTLAFQTEEKKKNNSNNKKP